MRTRNWALLLLLGCACLLTPRAARAEDYVLQPYRLLEGGMVGEMLREGDFLFISQWGLGRVYRCEKPLDTPPPCVHLPGMRTRWMTFADGVLYISTEKTGVFVSRNKGASFAGPSFSPEQVPGADLRFYQLATLSEKPIVGTNDGLYTLNGEAWERVEAFDVGHGQKGSTVKVLAADGDRAAAVAQGTYLYYTSNGGKTWKYLPNIAKKEIRSLLFRGDHLYVGVEDDGVWRVDVTTLKTQMLGLQAKLGRKADVSRLAFIDNLLLAAIDQDGLWGSTNGGRSWFEIRSEEEGGRIEPRGVASFALYKGELLVGGEDGRVWRLKDAEAKPPAEKKEDEKSDDKDEPAEKVEE